MAIIRILVVDDEELTGRLVQRILGSTLRIVGGWLPEFAPLADNRQVSMEIEVAHSAREAIDMWDKTLPIVDPVAEPYHLLVTDRDLREGGNGTDIIRHIRHTRGSLTPILFLSGDFCTMEDVEVREIERLVPKAFWLDKPMTPGKLVLVAFAALRPHLEKILHHID